MRERAQSISASLQNRAKQLPGLLGRAVTRIQPRTRLTQLQSVLSSVTGRRELANLRSELETARAELERLRAELESVTVERDEARQELAEQERERSAHSDEGPGAA